VSRIQINSDDRVDRLVCHPRLPLVAGEEYYGRPVAHVWDFTGGQLRKVGTISAAGDPSSWWPLAMSWEAGQSLLLAAGKGIRGAAGSVARWTPAGVAGLDGLPPTDRYSNLAFSPNGRALWASPSAGDPDRALSDIVDLASGTIWAGQRWDTGVAEHPAGGLVATLVSEQGATRVVFAEVDQGRAPAAMRLLRRALIFDNDGYATPVFSPDGRYLAIRGNSYGHSLAVFEFPSLRLALATDLEPRRAGMSDEERRDWFYSWSRHNIAFGAQSGVLWAGTPTGTLVETDLDSHQTASHDVLGGSPVTALAATASGDLIVATGGGDLALVSVTAGHLTAPAPDALRGQVAAFLASTSVVPDDRALSAHLVVTDGVRTWEPDDLATITTATEADPGWLWMTVFSNNARSGRWS
jgi:WD40 repeat protein